MSCAARCTNPIGRSSTFYQDKEKELFDALQTLKDLVTKKDEACPEAWEHYG
ncbi:hypothetical protein OG21DRAFT_1491603 [Imleria badia]|nr:hypothetical protein OG21DRAFT_1491603 [Imleria badia]